MAAPTKYFVPEGSSAVGLFPPCQWSKMHRKQWKFGINDVLIVDRLLQVLEVQLTVQRLEIKYIMRHILGCYGKSQA